mgnify:FL=1
MKEWKQAVVPSKRIYYPRYEAYLEGMETGICRKYHRSRCTYEAYLEGMETTQWPILGQAARVYEAYLEGMET